MTIENLAHYGYQGLHAGMKIHFLQNGIRYMKLSNAIAVVRAYPHCYKKDFHAMVTSLLECIDKNATMNNSIFHQFDKNDPIKKTIFEGELGFKCYSIKTMPPYLMSRNKSVKALTKY